MTCKISIPLLFGGCMAVSQKISPIFMLKNRQNLIIKEQTKPTDLRRRTAYKQLSFYILLFILLFLSQLQQKLEKGRHWDSVSGISGVKNLKL